jgi:hypothetical protein
MARSFSLALNDLFKIDNSLADLDASVSEKYLSLSAPLSAVLYVRSGFANSLQESKKSTLKPPNSKPLKPV